MTNDTGAATHLRASILAQEQTVDATTRALLERHETGLAALREALRVIGEPQGHITSNPHPDTLVAASETPEAAPEAATRKRRSRKVTPDIDLSGVHVDFTGTEKLEEHVFRIAETLPGMKLNVTQMANVLVRHGQSNAKIHNLGVNIKRALESHPGLFKRVEEDRATYLYLGNSNHQQETPEPAMARALGGSLNGRLTHDHE